MEPPCLGDWPSPIHKLLETFIPKFGTFGDFDEAALTRIFGDQPFTYQTATSTTLTQGNWLRSSSTCLALKHEKR